MCDKAFIEGKEMIITGDINLDYLKPTKLPNRWTSIMESYDMTQIIKEPTRVTERLKSCIDHIYVSNTEHVRPIRSLRYTRKHHAQLHNRTHNTIKFRSYKEFDHDLFLEDLNSVLWNQCDAFDDPNDALSCWQTLFLGGC